MRTSNYTNFRKNLKSHLDAVVFDNTPLLIERGDNTAVVVISLDEYNSIKETEYIMASNETMQDIENSRREIEEGRCREVNVNEL